MNQRTRDLLLLAALSILVNGIVAALVAQPGYIDAYYYFNGGKAIADGHGFVEPYLWNYAYTHPTLPAPAFAFWQPLPSILAAIGIALLRFVPAFDAAQVIFVLLAAALPVLSYLIGSELGERRHALLAGLLTVFSGFYVIYWSLPESFTPFAVSGAGALALAGAGMRWRRGWPWLAAGVCAAFGHLARADGVLLIGVVLAMALLTRVPTRARLTFAALSLVGYGIVMIPWYWRNWVTFGGLQAPGGLNALWLIEYNDLFNYPQNVTAVRYFAAGWGTILGMKLDALWINLWRFIAEDNLIFLTFLTPIGLWRRWRNAWLKPAVLYGIALFVAMTFAFSLVGANGGFFHSAGALLPFVFPAAVLGLDDVLHWAAARRGWNFRMAGRFFGSALIVMAALLTAYLVAARVVGLPYSGQIVWNNSHTVYAEIGAELSREGALPDAPVMSNDPPGFFYFTGHGGIALPNGDEPSLLRAADDYHVEFLVVDKNVPDGLISLFEHGPSTNRLQLIDTFGGGTGKVYLYRVLPR